MQSVGPPSSASTYIYYRIGWGKRWPVVGVGSQHLCWRSVGGLKASVTQCILVLVNKSPVWTSHSLFSSKTPPPRGGTLGKFLYYLAIQVHPSQGFLLASLLSQVDGLICQKVSVPHIVEHLHWLLACPGLRLTKWQLEEFSI